MIVIVIVIVIIIIITLINEVRHITFRDWLIWGSKDNIMIRDAQFNWEWSLIKMTTNLLHDKVTFYFAMLVIAPVKVTNQPMNLWSLSSGNDVL